MKRVYVDANVFITAFEAAPAIAAPAQALLTAARDKRIELVTSELTIAETLAPATAIGSLPLARKHQIYETLLTRSGIVETVPVSRPILIETAPIRAAHRQKLPDAIHLVTALESGCTHFCSADRDARRLPSRLTLILPVDHAIAALINAP